MNLLTKVTDLSPEALNIMESVYNNYLQNDSKIFEDFSQFNYSSDDLLKYCQELHDKGYVFLEYNKDNSRYLYMLFKVIRIINSK